MYFFSVIFMLLKMSLINKNIKLNKILIYMHNHQQTSKIVNDSYSTDKLVLGLLVKDWVQMRSSDLFPIFL